MERLLDLRLQKIALATRQSLLKMHFEAASGHLSCVLSCVDLLTYVYQAWLGGDDRFILSKGHAASSLYAALYHANLLEPE
ncbi:MAG: transketolase, partial [Deltaproteobacteria bacterium]